MAEFKVLRNGVIETYTTYEDIPDDFDNLIKFLPDFPEGPHSHDEHEHIEEWNRKLQLLMEKERARSNKNR